MNWHAIGRPMVNNLSEFRWVIAVILVMAMAAGLSGATAAEPSKQDLYWGSDGEGVAHPLVQATIASYIPEFLAREIKGVPVTVYAIDLDSDGAVDYIVHHNNIYKTCFIKSDNSKRSCEKLGYGDGFAYYWFAQLDQTPMLELFSMVGDEDYDDYQLYAFDSKTWRRRLLFSIAPVIVARKQDPGHKGIYWGYPWDVRSLYLKKVKGVIKMRASDQYRPLYEEEPESPRPAIFFDGLPTQGEENGYFKNLENEHTYYSLKELLRKYPDNPVPEK
ncbi:MAG: hypothetical protein OEY67_07695 [Gammaproteobacteria bacterium]|nr:hypothetical protein [Gammaproteobacteria bacterium]